MKRIIQSVIFSSLCGYPVYARDVPSDSDKNNAEWSEFMQSMRGNTDKQEKNEITLKRLFINGTALDAGEEVIYYTSLKKENLTVKSKKLDLIMDHLEIQLAVCNF